MLMHEAALILFWICLSLLAYAYFLYPLLLYFIRKIIKPKIQYDYEYKPSVTVVVAAHNEEEVIGDRIENLLNQEYPPERMDVVIASDNSSEVQPSLRCSVSYRLLLKSSR